MPDFGTVPAWIAIGLSLAGIVSSTIAHVRLSRFAIKALQAGVSFDIKGSKLLVDNGASSPLMQVRFVLNGQDFTIAEMHSVGPNEQRSIDMASLPSSTHKVNFADDPVRGDGQYVMMYRQGITSLRSWECHAGARATCLPRLIRVHRWAYARFGRYLPPGALARARARALID